MGFKINQGVKSYDIVGSDFEEQFSRLNDNNDFGLKGLSENFYIAQVVSGYSIAPVGDNTQMCSQPRLVDLGDGIKRYEVKIRMIGDIFFPSQNNNPPTNIFDNPLLDLQGNPGVFEWKSKFHPVAYTLNNKVQVPFFGCYVSIRETAEIYFIDRIINTKKVLFSAAGGAMSQFEDGAADGPIDVTGIKEIKGSGAPFPSNVLYKIEKTLPPAPSTGSSTVMPKASSELAFWKGKNETNPGVYTRLKAYWDNVGVKECPGKVQVGQKCWTPKGLPWSAAFVSYIMKGTGLKKSASHYGYIKKVLDGKSPGWKGYSLTKNKNAKINVGDILVKPRKGKPYNTHGDVVVKIENNKAYLAGGNVGSTAKVVGYVPLTAAGTATNVGIYNVILKKS